MLKKFSLNLLKTNSFRVILLSTVLTFGVIQKSEAKWFGQEREHVANQYAYGNTCVHVENVKTYFFGILVSEDLEFTPFEC